MLAGLTLPLLVLSCSKAKPEPFLETDQWAEVAKDPQRIQEFHAYALKHFPRIDDQPVTVDPAARAEHAFEVTVEKTQALDESAVTNNPTSVARRTAVEPPASNTPDEVVLHKVSQGQLDILKIDDDRAFLSILRQTLLPLGTVEKMPLAQRKAYIDRILKKFIFLAPQGKAVSASGEHKVAIAMIDARGKINGYVWDKTGPAHQAYAFHFEAPVDQADACARSVVSVLTQVSWSKQPD